MIRLGYRFGSTSFPVNADLVFKVPTGVRVIDSTGNPSSETELIQIGCYLQTPSGASVREFEPTMDIQRRYMKGRVIERVTPLGERIPATLLEQRLKGGMVADCQIYFPPSPGSGSDAEGLAGRFELELPAQSPWAAVRATLGDRIGGYFQQEGVSING